MCCGRKVPNLPIKVNIIFWMKKEFTVVPLVEIPYLAPKPNTIPAAVGPAFMM